jgi:leucyl aminopeptidase
MSMIEYQFSREVQPSPCLIIPVWEGKGVSRAQGLPQEVAAYLTKVLKQNPDFKGKKLQTLFLYTGYEDHPRVLVVGLGKRNQWNTRTLKHVLGVGVRTVQSQKIGTCSFVLPAEGIKKLGEKKAGYEIALGIELANYAFDAHKDKESRIVSVKKVTFIWSGDTRRFTQGCEEGRAVADATNLARRLGNTPPSIMTPTLLAREAQNAAKGIEKLTVKVLSRADMKKLGMGCLLGVSQGSVQEPKFIILEYLGAPTSGRGKQATSQKPTVLVGKGITFDSGGLSLKPGQYMNDMKFDMLGAATVLGSVIAAARLGIKKNIIALMPSCENMPSGSSYRPDDILTAMNGQSVLVENTDAEGRLILSDALCYAHKYDPREVIDFATLTGACMVALGNERSGLFSPDKKMVTRLLAASSHAGELLWHLPLGEEFSEAMKSEIADIKNIGGVGSPRYGGASTAAAFLQFFTTDPKTKKTYPWAHIDLSSSFWSHKGKPYMHGGANGFGVQTMVEYLRT